MQPRFQPDCLGEDEQNGVRHRSARAQKKNYDAIPKASERIKDF
jgi:hypothetical protein